MQLCVAFAPLVCRLNHHRTRRSLICVAAAARPFTLLAQTLTLTGMHSAWHRYQARMRRGICQALLLTLYAAELRTARNGASGRRHSLCSYSAPTSSATGTHKRPYLGEVSRYRGRITSQLSPYAPQTRMDSNQPNSKFHPNSSLWGSLLLKCSCTHTDNNRSQHQAAQT